MKPRRRPPVDPETTERIYDAIAGDPFGLSLEEVRIGAFMEDLPPPSGQECEG